MLRSLQITLALMLGITLGGCNRSSVQTAPAPSVNTSFKPIDNVPPPQDPNVRVNADRGNVDVKVDRPGLLRDRNIEVNRDADGGVHIKRDADNAPRRDGTDRPLRDRDIDIKVNPVDGVKVDLGK
jgi:HSP20 family molecular chaperone IbpA